MTIPDTPHDVSFAPFPTGRTDRSDGAMTDRAVRPVPLAIAIALHVAVIALLLLLPTPPRVLHKSTTIATFDVSATPAPPAAAPPRVTQPTPLPPEPPPILPPAFPVPSIAVAALPEPVDRQASDGACDLTAPVQAALRASDAVRTALPRIARGERSVANAIMLWNADWIADDATRDPIALAAIRAVVAATIAAASRECRQQPQRGPRLLILSGSDEDIVLALGSGAWRWQDVLDTAARPIGAPPGGFPTTEKFFRSTDAVDAPIYQR